MHALHTLIPHEQHTSYTTLIIPLLHHTNNTHPLTTNSLTPTTPAQRQCQREADELRLMRLEDAESKRANDLWKESERELTRMIGFESISESIESIVDDTFNLIGDANFDEAENQLQAELGNHAPGYFSLIIHPVIP